MPSPSRRKAKSITTRAAELAVAAPQVVAHRVARMAVAGPALSERDRKEFKLMVAEKQAALTQAIQAMAKVMAPVHRKAVANAKRLARTRLR